METTDMKIQMLPHELRRLRACLLCSLIKTQDQFEMEGCDNCDEFLHLRSNAENVNDFTSSNFDGIVALMSPEVSYIVESVKTKCVICCIEAILLCTRTLPSTICFLKQFSFLFHENNFFIKIDSASCGFKHLKI